MDKLDAKTVAAADQAMQGAGGDLDDTIANTAAYLAAGHDQAEAFVSLLNNMKGVVSNRPEMVIALAAVAIVRLAQPVDPIGEKRHELMANEPIAALGLGADPRDTAVQVIAKAWYRAETPEHDLPPGFTRTGARYRSHAEAAVAALEAAGLSGWADQ